MGDKGTDDRPVHDKPPRGSMTLVVGGIGASIYTLYSELDSDDPMSTGNIGRRPHDQSRRLEPVIGPMNGPHGERAEPTDNSECSTGLGDHGVNKPIVVCRSSEPFLLHEIWNDKPMTSVIGG